MVRILMLEREGILKNYAQSIYYDVETKRLRWARHVQRLNQPTCF